MPTQSSRGTVPLLRPGRGYTQLALQDDADQTIELQLTYEHLKEFLFNEFVDIVSRR